MTGRVVVAGIGSEHRRDDGVGPVVARLATGACRGGVPGPDASDVGPLDEPLDLLGRWDDAALAVVVDATCSGLPAGTVQEVRLAAGDAATTGPGRGTSPPRAGHRTPGTTSTHGIGLVGVLRLARAVGRAPREVVVVAIEGADFADGVGLTPAVAAAVPVAVERVRALIGGR